MPLDDAFFAGFVAWIFDRNVDAEPWFNTDDREYSRDYEKLLLACIRLFEKPAHNLSRFSLPQLRQGFFYMGVDHGYLRLIFEPQVSLEIRRTAVNSMLTLFRDYFQIDPVDDTCNMWWEYVYFSASPSGRGIYDDDPIFDEILRVLASILRIQNDQCIISALRGLGLTTIVRNEAVKEIINRFIADFPNLSPEILSFAAGCRDSRGWI
jgi:hypothetical protein